MSTTCAHMSSWVALATMCGCVNLIGWRPCILTHMPMCCDTHAHVSYWVGVATMCPCVNLMGSNHVSRHTCPCVILDGVGSDVSMCESYGVAIMSRCCDTHVHKSYWVGLATVCRCVNLMGYQSCRDVKVHMPMCDPPKNGKIALWPNTRVVKM